METSDPITIHHLAKWLEADNCACAIEDSTLMAIIGYRQDETPQTLEIKINRSQEQIHIYALDCQMEVSSLNSSEVIREVSSFLFFINRMSEPPGFFLHELDDTIYYRYVWIGTSLDAATLHALLERIADLFESYCGLITEIAKGQLSFHQALEFI